MDIFYNTAIITRKKNSEYEIQIFIGHIDKFQDVISPEIKVQSVWEK